MSERPFPFQSPPDLLGLLGAITTSGEPGSAPVVRRRVVYHSQSCGAHPHCDGECRSQFGCAPDAPLDFLTGTCPMCRQEVMVDEATGLLLAHNALRKGQPFPVWPKTPPKCTGLGRLPVDGKTWRA